MVAAKGALSMTFVAMRFNLNTMQVSRFLVVGNKPGWPVVSV